MTTTTTREEQRGQESLPRHDGGSLEWRFRLVVGCLALVALAFLQKPGKFVADTKLDLAVAPEALLGRAMHMWDAEGAFGQLQNQGYGYLFPMGPFFWLGDLAGMPGWAVQRGWYALVLVVAFVGLVKLAEALGIGSPLTRLVGGFAFALSPRLLTTLGPISIEAWPSALAPWVLIPLVYGSRRGSPVRAAALSAVAISCIGGVNAAAAAAVLPLPALWLLTRQPGARRRLMMLWWPVFTLMGTLWWLVPLFLLGNYSPPFLDFIESARATTLPTTLFDVLRGTSHWVPYIESDWEAGRLLLTEPYLIIDTSVVVLLGLVGLGLRSTPHRGFLLAGMLIGLVMVTAGHLGAVQGWLAADVNAWLDGALAPVRNVHKFDVILRLPLVLGLVHLLALVEHRLRDGGRVRQPGQILLAGLLVTGLVAVIGSATPLFMGKLTRSGEFTSIPDYWAETVGWLGDRDEGTYALLVPGSSFGSYVWGHPADEPVQPIASSPWAVRNAIPLAPPGNIRMLDAVEARLSTGQGSTGLAPYLARAGVEYLVVRNDLARSYDVAEPVLVHQALASSPGITLAARFGPDVGGEARLDDGKGPRVIVNQGWQSVYPAVEVYRVADAHRAVTSTAPPVVATGPEGLLRLTDLGVLEDEPTLLAVDADPRARPGRVVLTDGLRLKAEAFGRLHDNDSPTLTTEQAEQERRASREYVLGEDDRWATRARLEGLAALEASSSLSDLAGRAAQPEHSPFAAVDGDPRTSWVSGYREGPDGPSLELTFSKPVRISRVGVTLGDYAGRDTRRLAITTDSERTVSAPLQVEQPGTVVLEGRRTTTSLRVALAPGSRSFGARLDIAELEVPGVRVARPLVLPPLPPRWGAPETIVLSAGEGYASGCAEILGEVRCGAGRAREGEDAAVLDRVVTLNRGQDYAPRLIAAPRPGPELDELILRDRLVGVVSTSSAALDPRGGALAAVDGDPGTTWVADPDDVDPALRIQWLGRRTVDAISLHLSESAAAVPAVTVELVSPFGQRTVRLDDRGRARFAPLRTDQLTVRFRTWGRGSNLGFDETVSELSVGVSEIRLPGTKVLPITWDQGSRRWDCGSGPTVTVNGTVVRSALVASPRELYEGEPVEAKLCTQARLRLAEGENRITVDGAPGIRPDALVLEGRDQGPVGFTRAVGVSGSAPSTALVEEPTSPVVDALVLRQNVNPGWQARMEGEVLTPFTVDGWQQAWDLGDGERGAVAIEFVPDQPYRTGLLVGLLSALALLVVAAATRAGAASDPLGPRRPRAWLLVLPVVAVLGLLAGTVAAVMGAVAASLALWSPVRRWLHVLPFLAALPLGAAAVLYATSPWGDPWGWAGSEVLPQLLAAAALALVLAAALGDRPPRRMNGRSTTQ